MSGTYNATAELTNFAGDKAARRSTQSVRLIDRVMRVAHTLWDTKPAAELALRSKVSQRSVEHWLQGRSGLSADALANLLRSDEGLKFLEVVIGDSRPVWWADFRRSVKLAALQRQQNEVQKAIEQLQRQLAEEA